MNEQQLTEIEDYANVLRQLRGGQLEQDMVPELIAEVRRLRALLDSANETIEVLDYQVQSRYTIAKSS